MSTTEKLITTRFESYSRLTGHETFRSIAQKHISRFEEINPRVGQLSSQMSDLLSSADDPDDPPAPYYEILEEFYRVRTERDECSRIAIVFAAMYLEAFIYDYAASCLGDKYVQDYIDKLDFLSKWIVVPRLTVGKEIDKGSHGFEALKKLHTARNALVHLKSRDGFLSAEELGKLLTEAEQSLLKSIDYSKKAIKLMPEALFSIDTEHPMLRLAVK